MEKTYSVIGKQLLKQRNALDITQEQLAELIDVSEKSLRKINTNFSQCSLETLMKLCRTLNISPNYLLLGTDEDWQSSEWIEIEDKLKRLSDRDRQFVKEFVKWYAEKDY